WSSDVCSSDLFAGRTRYLPRYSTSLAAHYAMIFASTFANRPGHSGTSLRQPRLNRPAPETPPAIAQPPLRRTRCLLSKNYLSSRHKPIKQVLLALSTSRTRLKGLERSR